MPFFNCNGHFWSLHKESSHNEISHLWSFSLVSHSLEFNVDWRPSIFFLVLCAKELIWKKRLWFDVWLCLGSGSGLVPTVRLPDVIIFHIHDAVIAMGANAGPNSKLRLLWPLLYIHTHAVLTCLASVAQGIVNTIPTSQGLKTTVDCMDFKNAISTVSFRKQCQIS